MIRVSIAQIKTRDGIVLGGIYIPPKRRHKAALIWIPGLGSRFSSGQDLMKEISSRLARSGIGYFKFDTRGHDIIARGVKGSRAKALVGSAFEKFRDCLFDIRAMIEFARKQGYQDIILAGHSTGANKALYYLYKTRDRRVKELMLLGPISDVVVCRIQLKPRELRRSLMIAERLARKNPLALMPQKYGIYTAERYLSLCRPGGAEDVFPYHNPKASWKELKSVRVPLAIALGSRDAFLYRSAKSLIEIYKNKAVSTESFRGIVIKGAPHGFQKREKELSRAITNWIRKISRRRY